MTLKNAFFSLWRRLPITPRQRAAHFVLGRIAPRLPPAPGISLADKNIPRIVVGFLSSSSGLGQSARLTGMAFAQQGFDVTGIDVGRYFYQEEGVVRHDLPDGRHVTGQAQIIIVVNGPYLPYTLWLLGRRFLRDKHVTGYWAWELPALPETWRRGLSSVHDIATPSSFSRDAVSLLAPDLTIRAGLHPVTLDPPPQSGRPPEPRDGDRPFTVLSALNVASGFERKNPLALIAAFRQAFGAREDCRLRLLITNASHYPPARNAIAKAVGNAANIEICWRTLNRDKLWQWWGTPDVYASLHRSEGFGLPLAEAMFAGCPVMATGWSGNMDFMTHDNSCPVRFSLIDVADPQEKYARSEGQWAEADVAHAITILQRLEADPELRHAIGRRARESMTDKLSAKAFVAAMTTSADSSEPPNAARN